MKRTVIAILAAGVLSACGGAPGPTGDSQPAVEILNVVAELDHVAMLAERGEGSVVLERKMSGHHRQVNARFMSSCVSNARRQIARGADKAARGIVTRS